MNFLLNPSNSSSKCFVCEEITSKEDFRPNELYRSVGIRDCDEQTYEILYMDIVVNIPICKKCKASMKSGNNYIDWINRALLVLFAIIPYFFLSNDLDLLTHIFYSVLISIGAIKLIRPVILLIICLKVLGSESDKPHPLVQELNSKFWCLAKPSKQIMPGMHLAVPSDGDYDSCFQSLFEDLSETAKKYEYEVTFVDKSLKWDKCTRNKL